MLIRSPPWSRQQLRSRIRDLIKTAGVDKHAQITEDMQKMTMILGSANLARFAEPIVFFDLLEITLVVVVF